MLTVDSRHLLKEMKESQVPIKKQVIINSCISDIGLKNDAINPNSTTILPASMTQTRSEPRMVSNRCAIVRTVHELNLSFTSCLM